MGDAGRTLTANQDTVEATPSRYLSTSTLAPGTLVDRYRIEAQLGAGGMGVVYAAFDPELDRRVAVKLVRDLDDAGAAARRDRLLREARAMAKLDHANVVRVFDAGTTASHHVFVAMELVDGERLDTWARGRSTNEILRALVAAGRGLVAAHAAGIIHRDFKPDNVLVDRSGRVRVGDFGLAAAPGEATAIMGTPAFMAPEQERGEPADARADQYAFCATAWRLVFGEPPSQAAHKPAWLASLLRTGLAPDPADRHASLDTILDEIDRRLARRRRWPFAVGAVALGTAGFLLARGDGAARTCAPADERLARVWNAALAQSLGTTPAALTTAHAIEQRARAWARAAAESCHARDEGALAIGALERRDACLDRQRAQLAGLVARLASRPDLLVDGTALVESLPPVRDCIDPAQVSLELELPADAALRRAVVAQLPQLAIAGSFTDTGRFDEAAQILDAIPASASAYPPFGAEIAYARADLESTRGKTDKGNYDEAIRLGTAAGHEALVVRAMLDQAWSLEPAEAKRWYGLVDAKLTRLGDPPDLRAHFYGNRVSLDTALGDHAAAIADAERCVAIRRAHDGPVARSTITAIMNLAEAFHVAGRSAEARALLVDILATAERTLDPDHGTILAIRSNLVDLHVHAQDFAAARIQYDKMMATRRRIYGAADPQRVFLQLKQASILLSANAIGDAVKLLEEARAAAPGDDPQAQIGVHQVLSIAYSRARRHADAIAAAEQALRVLDASRGPKHPARVALVAQLAYILYLAGELPRADTEARQAVALAAEVLPADSPGAANPHGVLASVACAQRDYATARHHAERAIELAKQGRPDVEAEAELALACALDGAGDRKRARTIAQQSLAHYTQLGPSASADRAKAEAWLRDHP